LGAHRGHDDRSTSSLQVGREMFTVRLVIIVVSPSAVLRAPTQG